MVFAFLYKILYEQVHPFTSIRQTRLWCEHITDITDNRLCINWTHLSDFTSDSSCLVILRFPEDKYFAKDEKNTLPCCNIMVKQAQNVYLKYFCRHHQKLEKINAKKQPRFFAEKHEGAAIVNRERRTTWSLMAVVLSDWRWRSCSRSKPLTPPLLTTTKLKYNKLVSRFRNKEVLRGFSTEI